MLDSQDILLFLAAIDMFKGKERLVASNILEEPIKKEETLKKLYCTIKGINKLNIVAYNIKDLDKNNNASSNYLLNKNNIELETTNKKKFKTA